MAAHIPNVRSRRLAAELRGFRDEAGMTWEAVAERMGWSTSKIYRIEGDKVSVLLRDVQRLLDLYGVAGAHKDAVLELARQARRKDWWHQYSGAIPEWFQFYVGLEAEATTLREYETEFVPGVLQTGDYARAIMSTAPEPDNEEAERQIAVRMERQKRLTGDNPLTLWVVLNEAVIRRLVGGRKVMADQLTHLAELAKLRNVTVQILTYAAGAHPAMHGAFTIMEFPEEAHPDVVYLEAQTGALYLEMTTDLRRYSVAFDYLRAQALGPAESQALIAQAARELP
ncbi:MAG: helix-turn-helix transcriptional regulator [Actinomycetota bacterium]